ncbi:hypothetical protein Poly41_08500 [Novipirellula artificiosorum]|uniref:DUF11 domain-containing protein n=2 Tax=Novipirellula artificiosorum TaxID=2528016 RepID=A0A5C6DYN5_9BACT|nr:hypothetical protein Poly41_08500 [Novipirellula artificiosorum]
MLLLVVLSSGCGRLRLPAIDPSGTCLFAPCPAYTALAPPCTSGQGCCCLGGLRGIGSCLLPSCLGGSCVCNDSPGVNVLAAPGATGLPAPATRSRCTCLGCLGGFGCLGCLCKPFSGVPDPAFPEPVPPPECPGPVAAPATMGGAAVNDEPCVPGPACGDSCPNGPPAVLYGAEIGQTEPACLPESGERGCILLSPQKIVAPVGGEVILLSGICGTDGYLQMGQPLEWMLTPESVGTFIQVGNDDPGLVHRLAGIRKAEKHDPSYAIGVTSTKRSYITRGNLDPKDDVKLEKGQTWLSLSSPTEGTSRVTVLASESECWDQRKATATIYWIDARWLFPSPQREIKGNPVALNTRVTRAEGTLPARGWKVRYEIQQPELATFAGTGGSSVVEVNVDDSGDAPAELIPNPGTSGTAMIDIQVIRPGGDSDNMPTMTLGRGSTTVTWSSPQLLMRAGAPAVASFDVPFEVVANVSNPGDQPATNVRVSVALPPGTRVIGANLQAQVLPNAVVWEVGDLPAQMQLDMSMTVVAQSTMNLTFQARADAGLLSEDTVRVDVYRPSLEITAAAQQERYEAGKEVTFEIAVKNRGDRPLANVKLRAFGDEGMVHHENGTRDVGNDKTDGPLQPGQSWTTNVTYVPTRAGRRCVNFEGLADGGQRDSTDACVTVINPVPPAPALTVRLDGRDRVKAGDLVMIRAYVTNTGEVVLEDTQVVLVYDPQLQLAGATVGADQPRPGQSLIQWNLPTLDPGQPKVLEAQFRAVATNPQSRARLSATSRDGTTAQTDLAFAIVAGPPPVAAPQTGPPPTLPPALPPPTIPGGPGTLPPSNVPPPGMPPSSTPPAMTRSGSGQIQVELFGRDNPVAVGQPIRYTLRVTNDSNEVDGEVSLSFLLPPGVTIDSIAQRRSPAGGQYEMKAGKVYLAEIRSMRPGESVEYDLVLRSNQPQAITLMAEAVSRRGPGGSDSVQTEVRP